MRYWKVDEEAGKRANHFMNQTGYCITTVRYLVFCEKRDRFEPYAGNRSHESMIENRAGELGDLLNRSQMQIE